ncbi:hypothetical protein [Methylobacterium sp. 174MFSha1.1]|uniref:hypothetical protein n=1 Tax=Methylobacterium sp. 174MFSha1.1 TaxID=1502749 RepID=UPI00116092E0|nr:hypothetical protein [Methylobacterium sp. 174MFSha1.1]
MVSGSGKPGACQDPAGFCLLRNLKHLHLACADQQIAECEQRISCLLDKIEQKKADEKDTKFLEKLAQLMFECLDHWRVHRQAIMEDITQRGD